MNILSSMLTYLAEKIGGTTMGTTATTVTGAIAEHESDISSLRTSFSALDIKCVNASLGSITVNSSGGASGTIDVSDSIPSGYTAIAAIPNTSNSYGFYFYTCSMASNTTVYAQLFRNAGSATSITPRVTLICVKGF